MPPSDPAPDLAAAVEAAKRFRKTYHHVVCKRPEGHDQTRRRDHCPHCECEWDHIDMDAMATALLALAAGREDDGEGITRDWLHTVGREAEPGAWTFSESDVVVHFDDEVGGWVAVLLPTVLVRLDSRGQLRALLHGLGVRGTTEGRG